MPEKIESILDASEKLGDNGPMAPNTTYSTVREFVDDLIAYGNTDAVYPHHDDHLGLSEQLTEDFLNSSLNEVDEKYPEQSELVLEQAEIIIPLLFRKADTNDDY